MPIVVGVDGSSDSAEALRWALAEARLRGNGCQGNPLLDSLFRPETIGEVRRISVVR